MAFEKQMAVDPALKKEVEFQESVITEIKSARAAELKAMLNRVPVGGGTTVHFTVARLAAGIIGLGIVAASAYFIIRSKQVPELSNAAADLIKKKEQLQQGVQKHIPDPAIVPLEKKAEDKTVKSEETTTVPGQVHTNSGVVVKPSLQIEDPSQEMEDNSGMPSTSEQPIDHVVSVSNIAVETDSANKRFNFHYQFAGGKLYLYGPFDKSLYEILEINTANHLVFLYYKSNFYLLDEKQLRITPLQPVADEALLQKLKEYRGK